jgi:hypothetical protein
VTVALERESLLGVKKGIGRTNRTGLRQLSAFAGPGHDLNRMRVHVRQLRQIKCRSSYMYAVMALFLAHVSFISIGLVCTQSPPPRIANEKGLCFEVIRHAHYNEIVYLSGTPVHEYRLLLRFETSLESSSVHLYSNNPRWSSTLECSYDEEKQEEICSDMVVMSQGEQRVHVVDSMKISRQDALPMLERSLGLDGSFVMSANRAYRLSSHRLCSKKETTCDTIPSDFDKLTTHMKNGMMYTSIEYMQNNIWSESIVRRARCSEEIMMFPMELASPQMTFSTPMNRMLQNTQFSKLYETYELGQGKCAELLEKDQKNDISNILVKDACANSACRQEPSVSYTYAATFDMILVIGDVKTSNKNGGTNGKSSGTGCLGARVDHSLEEIQYVATQDDMMFLAIIRLFLMIFAAAIVYVRSSDVSVKVDSIFVRCIEAMVNGKVSQPQNITIERGVLTFVAALVRVCIPLFRWHVLEADGLRRVLTTELTAGVASLIHWTLLHVDCSMRRFKVLVFESVPLFLGGSSAVIDVSCTTMLAFTVAPIHGGSSTFDTVVRMLTAVLISLVCISRCFFSISCAGLVMGVHKRWPIGDLILMTIATIFWIIQTISIAVVICDLYSTPTAWSFARSLHIDVRIVATTIFSVFSVMAGPTIAMTAMRITEQIK